MKVKFIYRLHKLFQEWRKADDPMTRFFIIDQIDALIAAELAQTDA